MVILDPDAARFRVVEGKGTARAMTRFSDGTAFLQVTIGPVSWSSGTGNT